MIRVLFILLGFAAGGSAGAAFGIWWALLRSEWGTAEPAGVIVGASLAGSAVGAVVGAMVAS